MAATFPAEGGSAHGKRWPPTHHLGRAQRRLTRAAVFAESGGVVMSAFPHRLEIDDRKTALR